MPKALARFAVVDSRRWIRFLPGLLPKLDNTNFAALPPVEQQMLQMFYVTLWGKAAESWENEEVLDNLYSTFGHKLSDGNIRILFAGEQLTLGTKRLFQVFRQSVANCIYTHCLRNLIGVQFRVRFKPQIAEP